MRRTLLSCLAVSLVSLFAGWYPEYTKRTRAEAESSAASLKLREAGQSLGLSQLKNRAGMLWDQVERNDYGATGEMASRLFTDLRAFTNELPPGDLRQRLERSLGSRDAIIASIAKADPSAKGLIRDLFTTFPEH
ncbi:MAG: hypothetical protein ABL995_17235 [Bryobacteraceae bacterium]